MNCNAMQLNVMFVCMYKYNINMVYIYIYIIYGVYIYTIYYINTYIYIIYICNIHLALSKSHISPRSGGLADPGGPGEVPHGLRGETRQLRGAARGAEFHRGTGHDALRLS